MRVIVAEDAVLLREALAALLRDAGVQVLAEVGDPHALLMAIAREPPDVAVLDVRMPPTHTDEGLQAARAIRAQWPRVGLLILTQHAPTGIAVGLIDALGGTGGVGYLLKERVDSGEEFIASIRRVAAGGSAIDPSIVERLMRRGEGIDGPLTALAPRERAVLALMAEGNSNAGIAERLSVSARTVEAHIRNIFDKLELSDDAGENRRVRAVLTYLRAAAR